MEDIMSFMLLFTAIVGITLPDPAGVHTIRSGDSCPIVYEDGTAWIGIFESDYTLLRVSTDSHSGLRAFDASGNLCALARDGEELILSAFSDYRFYLTADNPEVGTDSVTFYVSDVVPDTITAEEAKVDTISLGMMGVVYRFIPSVTGEWTFNLEGPKGTDFDLEVYGTGFYSTWGISNELESRESVTVSAIAGEILHILVKKIYPKEEGEISLTVAQTGNFPTFPEDEIVLNSKITYGEIKRILLPGNRVSPCFLSVDSGSEVDLDVYIIDQTGETLMSSIDDGARETLIIPPGRDELVVEIHPYYVYEGTDYEMKLIPLEGVYSETLSEEPVQLSADSCSTIGFSPDTTGFYSIEADFTGLKDCNFEIFRNSGDEVLNFNLETRESEFLLYIAQSDTIWLNPFLPDYMRNISGTAYISVRKFTDSPLPYEEYRDSITTESPVAMFIVSSDSNAVLDITLYGEYEEVDLDMFVSGPGIDITANAWLNSVDGAGHESVAVYSPDEAQYAVTVYLWDKEGQTPYTLNAKNIVTIPLAEPSPEEQIWVLVAGISDYPGSRGDLNRASMDAIEFYRFITNIQGIPYSQTVLLVDATATADAFRNACTDILEAAGLEDRIIISYSGHGSQEGIGTGGPEEYDFNNEVLCLYDADVTDDWLSDAIENGPGCPVIIYLDACHSGGFVNDFSEGSNTQIITAAREDLGVYERIFMPILLDAVTGSADLNMNGYVSTSEILVYVDEQLEFMCPECGARIEDNGVICADCGTIFKEDNPVPQPQQGNYLEEEIDIWRVIVNEGNSE